MKRCAPVAALVLSGMLTACAQTPPAPPEAVAKGAVDTTTCSRPVYPALAAANKIEGTSTFQFQIGPDGKVLQSRLAQSSGDASLDEAARSGLSKCTFKPALYQGKPVTAWTAVQYVWSLK